MLHTHYEVVCFYNFFVCLCSEVQNTEMPKRKKMRPYYKYVAFELPHYYLKSPLWY